MSLIHSLKGTGVAIITPFKTNTEVDFESLGNLIDRLIAEKVNYIVTLGTTGETPTLSHDEKIAIINFTYEKVNGKVPVVVGIGGNNTNEIVHHLKTYPLEKAVAVLSASPAYNKPSQEGIYQHYKAIADASPKPVILYNVPGRTSSNISAETTLRLSKLDNIQGIKEASGNMVQCMHILKERSSDFLVISGDDHLTLPLIACGMDGVISVAANCFAKVFCEMVNLCLEGNFEKARELHYKCLYGNDLLFAENNPAGVKAFLAEQGIIQNVLRLPLVPLSEGWHKKVIEFLSKY